MKKINNITPFSEDISKWYTDLVIQPELVTYAPVKGTVFLRPYGYKIWDLIKRQMTEIFEIEEIEEVSFPLLIPESLFNKEKEHIDGFAPELLTVTRVGDKNFNDPLVIRPTSEVLFGKYFEETLTSYKQLPVILNQWANIMRWENNTRPFLRTSEFLWQEGHTVHTTEEEALNMTHKMINIYANFAKNYLNLPVIIGKKTISERFAGAKETWTIETILKDGQALQSGTSHYLAQSFTEAFEVKVQDKENNIYNPYATSWGVSTRLIGALIMTHSDDKGLMIPEKVAPYQVVIMTLFADKNPNVFEEASLLAKNLRKSGIRVKLDNSDKRIGFKSQEWEVKGIPIRIEFGPRDLENKNVVIVRRDQEKKRTIPLNSINSEMIRIELKEYSETLYNKALINRENFKREIISIEEVEGVVEAKNYAIGYWKENSREESKMKEKTGATIRCLLDSEIEGKCIHSGEITKKIAIIARAY